MSQMALFTIAPSTEGIDTAKVAASISCECIATRATIKKPVTHCGALWVSTGCTWQHGVGAHEVYQLVPLGDFAGESYSYNVKSGIWREGDKYPGDFARSDPNGFYHGMIVKHGADKLVLSGPPQIVVHVEKDFYADAAEDDDEDYGDGEPDEVDVDDEHDEEEEAA
jgi:hypothetical protein